MFPSPGQNSFFDTCIVLCGRLCRPHKTNEVRKTKIPVNANRGRCAAFRSRWNRPPPPASRRYWRPTAADRRSRTGAQDKISRIASRTSPAAATAIRVTAATRDNARPAAETSSLSSARSSLGLLALLIYPTFAFTCHSSAIRSFIYYQGRAQSQARRVLDNTFSCNHLLASGVIKSVAKIAAHLILIVESER